MPEPIPCPAAEVEAMLSGRKTMLRRVLKPEICKPLGRRVKATDPMWAGLKFDRAWARTRHPWFGHLCPHLVAPWVHPEEAPKDDPDDDAVYRINLDFQVGQRLCVRAMAQGRRRASRLTLLIAAVKVERLQDISEADAIAEGLEVLRQDREIAPPTDFVRNCVSWDQPATETTVGCSHSYRCPIQAFRAMWDATHPPAERWSENPWVAAVSFNLIPANIDTPEAQPSGRVASEESEP